MAPGSTSDEEVAPVAQPVEAVATPAAAAAPAPGPARLQTADDLDGGKRPRKRRRKAPKASAQDSRPQAAPTAAATVETAAEAEALPVAPAAGTGSADTGRTAPPHTRGRARSSEPLGIEPYDGEILAEDV